MVFLFVCLFFPLPLFKLLKIMPFRSCIFFVKLFFVCLFGDLPIKLVDEIFNSLSCVKYRRQFYGLIGMCLYS